MGELALGKRWRRRQPALNSQKAVVRMDFSSPFPLDPVFIDRMYRFPRILQHALYYRQSASFHRTCPALRCVGMQKEVDATI